MILVSRKSFMRLLFPCVFPGRRIWSLDRDPIRSKAVPNSDAQHGPRRVRCPALQSTRTPTIASFALRDPGRPPTDSAEK